MELQNNPRDLITPSAVLWYNLHVSPSTQFSPFNSRPLPHPLPLLPLLFAFVVFVSFEGEVHTQLSPHMKWWMLFVPNQYKRKISMTYVNACRTHICLASVSFSKRGRNFWEHFTFLYITMSMLNHLSHFKDGVWSIRKYKIIACQYSGVYSVTQTMQTWPLYFYP